jgi:hypothetical protein
MAQRRTIHIPTLQVEWPGVFENWSHAWVQRNYWKVREHFPTREDAMAHCALIWTRCLRRYEYSVDNPAWFMSLFQRAVANDWTTYAAKSTHQRGLIVDQQRFARGREEEDESWADRVGPTEDSQGYLLTLLGEASEELKQVLKMLANAPAESLEILFSPASPEALNRTWKRWAKIQAPSKDVVAELRSLLTP